MQPEPEWCLLFIAAVDVLGSVCVMKVSDIFLQTKIWKTQPKQPALKTWNKLHVQLWSGSLWKASWCPCNHFSVHTTAILGKQFSTTLSHNPLLLLLLHIPLHHVDVRTQHAINTNNLLQQPCSKHHITINAFTCTNTQQSKCKLCTHSVQTHQRTCGKWWKLVRNGFDERQ